MIKVTRTVTDMTGNAGEVVLSERCPGCESGSPNWRDHIDRHVGTETWAWVEDMEEMRKQLRS